MTLDSDEGQMGNWYPFIVETVGAVGIATGGVASIALIVWAIFRALSTKWLDAKFEERLASYKHAQDRELEDLRFQINTQLDRLTKLHQHEFDILPEAWRRCIKAYYKISALVSPLQSYPDLDRMNENSMNFLVALPLRTGKRIRFELLATRTTYTGRPLSG